MKLKAKICFNAEIDVPQIVVDNTPGGVEAIKKVFADRLSVEMALKFGKAVDVEITVPEEREEEKGGS
jgi:hypothetical protein